MSKTQGIYKVKDKELIYSTYFAWLILNTPEEYKEVVAQNWCYGKGMRDNGTFVELLFTAEHESFPRELACVQEVVTKKVYIIAFSALEPKEDTENKEKSFLDRLDKKELKFLQDVAIGDVCYRDCDTCILNNFPELDCANLAKDLLEKLK